MTQTLTYIAITSASGSLKIRQIVTVAERRAFSDEAGAKNGYALSEDGTQWVRDLDDDAEVIAELERSGDDYSGGWRRIAPEDLPAPEMRVFRSAWQDNGKEVGVDLNKARDITKKIIRSERVEMFAKLDAEIAPLQFKSAVGALTADEKLEITALEGRRQKLRDAPADPKIATAIGPSELVEHLRTFGEKHEITLD